MGSAFLLHTPLRSLRDTYYHVCNVRPKQASKDTYGEEKYWHKQTKKNSNKIHGKMWLIFFFRWCRCRKKNRAYSMDIKIHWSIRSPWPGLSSTLYSSYLPVKYAGFWLQYFNLFYLYVNGISGRPGHMYSIETFIYEYVIEMVYVLCVQFGIGFLYNTYVFFFNLSLFDAVLITKFPSDRKGTDCLFSISSLPLSIRVHLQNRLHKSPASMLRKCE